MVARLAIAGLIAVAATACEVERITGPTIVPGPTVAAVPTTRPGIWGSRSELSAWVENGVSAGPATVVGEGDAAVIRIELGRVGVRLQSPDFDPPPFDLQTLRVRYRWLDGLPTDQLSIDLHLRPPTLTGALAIPWLFMVPKRSTE